MHARLAHISRTHISRVHTVVPVRTRRDGRTGVRATNDIGLCACEFEFECVFMFEFLGRHR